MIDPFAAFFEMAGFGLDHEGWVRTELMVQKTLQNQVGNFHQNILGSIEGWENLQTGFVVVFSAPIPRNHRGGEKQA